MGIEERVSDLVEPICERLHVEFVDLEYHGGLLRLTVDRADGVDMDVIRRLTKAVSRALDDADPISGTYTLEVSSPGLERKLRRPEHFARAVGEHVAVKTKPGVDGDRRVAGALTAADDDGIDVTLADGGIRRLGYDEVLSARTTFQWPISNKAKHSPKGSDGGKNGPHADRKART